MSTLLILAFLFFMGCILGWCLEVVYRRFKKDNVLRKWVNPGFLTGPYLPLYGFGLCALYLMANLERYTGETGWSKLVLFLMMSAVMTLMEYVAGLVFIKGMKIKLWDYSGEKFNVQGIICLRFSVYWAILGAVYYFLIHPHILSALAWFANNVAFSFFVGMFFGIFMVDLGYTLGIAAKVRAFAVENQLLIRYELLKDEIRFSAEQRKEKVRFLFSFASDVPLVDHLRKYRDLQEAFGLNPIEAMRGISADLKDSLDEKKAYIGDMVEEKIDAMIEERGQVLMDDVRFGSKER